MHPFLALSIYNLITLFLVMIGIILCKKKLKDQKSKDITMKITSIMVVILHYSSLYVEFFQKGSATVDATMLLPIYPCHISMWLLVISSFIKKERRMYPIISEFTFFGGTICGLIGVLFNINFLNTPNFLDYDILKGLLSHTVMIFGTLNLFYLGYVKIDIIRNIKSVTYGLILFVMIGFVINTIYYVCGFDPVNAMFMLEPPIPELPFFNFFTMGLLGLLLLFGLLNLYEAVKLPKEKRWLTTIRKEKRNK